jgi:hypothetical protein
MGARKSVPFVVTTIRALAKSSFGPATPSRVRLPKGNRRSDQQQIKLRSEPDKS